jgi:hypothetical protein
VTAGLDIHGVDIAGDHAGKQLTGGGNGIGHLANLQYLWPAETVDLNGAHLGPSERRDYDMSH